MEALPVKQLSLWRAGAGAALAFLCGAAAQAQQQPGPGGIYTCVDAKGRRLTADRPIPECSDREQRVLGPSGTERSRVGPILSDQERAAMEAQRRKEADERARAAEERRRERVLVARYPDKAAHDAERAAAIAQVNEVTAVAEARVAELRRQRKALDAEMEFYRRDPSKAPMALRRQIAEQEESLAQQQRFIASQEEEKRRVHQRFDAELAQLRQLWAAQQGMPAMPASR
ncbi:DUF4124 domain-containing protein [Paracidovorax avenae]|uniref:DUF4124 domain-containing protein n=1 Tax=Paracidovorax avenae TaxID=80867 RepID=UPI000D167F98|nr:DUF4124 domain-containing protein [Paracidovorax avenae]AVS69194.1 DUF4124 domain-containing protein [Paracidovorax avenae]